MKSNLIALSALLFLSLPAVTRVEASPSCVPASEEAIRMLSDGLLPVVERIGQKLQRRVVRGVNLNKSPDGGCSIEVQAIVWAGAGGATLYVRGLNERNVPEKLAELETLIEFELKDQANRQEDSMSAAIGAANSNPSPSKNPRLSDGIGVTAGTGSKSYLSIWVELPSPKKEVERYADDGVEVRYSWARISLNGGTLGKSPLIFGSAPSTAPASTTMAQISLTVLERAKQDRSSVFGSRGAQIKYGILRVVTFSAAGVWDRQEDARAFSKLFTLNAAEWTGGSSFPIGSARFDGLVSIAAGIQVHKETRAYVAAKMTLQLTFKNGFFLDFNTDSRREYVGGDKGDPSVTDFNFGLGKQFKGGWVTRAGMTYSDFRTSQKEDQLDICPQCGAYETYDGVNFRPEGWSTGLTIFKRF